MTINLDVLSQLLERDCDGNDPVCRAARTMAQLSHPQRLRVLCLLVNEGELSVADLLKHIPLTASALSQHLAKMKDEGLISSRRIAKNVYYTIQRNDIRELLKVMHKLYCSGQDPTEEMK
jgi:ArsR family transcriptional regulator, virulence genes transcriptional regulator